MRHVRRGSSAYVELRDSAERLNAERLDAIVSVDVPLLRHSRVKEPRVGPSPAPAQRRSYAENCGDPVNGQAGTEEREDESPRNP